VSLRVRRTTLPDAAVVEATDIIWEALFGSRLEAVAPAPASSSADLTGSIQISGAWEGVVVLGASRLIAQRLAGLMLEMAEPVDADICDVIGELANLIAGAVQALLPVPSDLSLPSVVAGKDYRLIFPRCSIVNESTSELLRRTNQLDGLRG
jgi:CheY-specific phosphatase CheX